MLVHGGVIGASGVSAGSSLLLGSNADPAGTDIVESNQFFCNHVAWTAAASGTPATIYVNLSDWTGTHIVAAIYNSAGSLVAQTAAKNVTDGWNACTVTGSPGSIVSGQTYFVGYVANGYMYGGRRTATWQSDYKASTYPAVPSDLTTGLENKPMPEPAIYVMS